MFIDSASFVKALGAAFSSKWFSPRRLGFILLCTLAIVSIQLIVLVMQFLDELFFPSYHMVRIDPPLIIAANPRSGTTLLHRLLCLDEERFFTFKLYHVLFPSISVYKLFHLFAPVGRPPWGPIKGLIEWFSTHIFARWTRIHSAALNEPEEDEALLFLSFVSASIYMVFPFFDEVPAPRSADGLPRWKREALVRCYRNCVRRFLYAEGAGRDWQAGSGKGVPRKRVLLLKSVFFPSRMRIMNEVFPEARIVYLLRNPCEAIPSLISTFTSLFWRIHSPDIPENSDHYRWWARLGADYYRYFFRNRRIYGEDRLRICLYRDLIGDPTRVVRDLYRHFRIPLGDTFLCRLAQEVMAQRGYRSRHEYSLERYGLSRRALHEELKEIFESYRLE